MRIMGMDYGSKTLGISLSDETRTLATPIETIKYKEKEELFTKIEQYFKTYEIESIILGNPLNLDGSLSDRSKITLEFKEELEKRYKIPVKMEDERYTTVIVNNMLIENNTRRDKRKKVVDKLASTVILQGYLDRRNQNERK
ncbi:MAG: Holliday junction resolvase RuvX [Bacilli bacterium]|nr:Holliday junction resolvase RuvX [Bacilli bacterium]